MRNFPFLMLVSIFCLNEIQGACGGGQSEIRIDITSDNYPNETTWSLRDFATNTLIDTGQVNDDTICVSSSQCVIFTIFDAANDGICCGFGQGSYSLYLNNQLVVTGGQFASRESTTFNCPPGVSCSSPLVAIEDTMTAPFPDAWYTFVPDTSGIYKIHTCTLGNSCDTKLYVYAACQGITINENNPGTIFYNDDQCPNYQSEITSLLQSGVTYFIRVGDYQTSCVGQQINWQISYQGPVMGCMDSTSCNFNPLATVDTGGCIYPPSSLCPAPDLVVVQSALETSMYVDNLTVQANNCYISEGCLAGYGDRRLIRFTTHIKNIGDLDYYIGAPDTVGDQFVYGACHGHWHYEGYAEYLLYDQNFQPVQSGFKNGFCVLDLECSGGGDAKYGCNNMGISYGCGDIYDAGLSCQWIDITDVDTGKYTFIVRVNWDQSPDKLGHYEKRYDNNQAYVCLHIYYDNAGFKIFDIIPDCATLVDCEGDTFGTAVLDCENVCNGSHIRGDVNFNLSADSVDFNLYLNGVKEDTIVFRTCIDLNDDSTINVIDAVRLNGCILDNNNQHNHTPNYQNTHKHCEFPFNVFNPFDSVTFSISHIDWNQKYIDISVLNPTAQLLAYEFRMKGITIDSVRNLALGNYHPDIRWSTSGHIIGISPDENALFKQLIPLNFLRIYYASLTDSIVCIDKIIAAANSNYEEVKGKISGICFTEPTDTTVSGIRSLNTDEVFIIPNPGNGLFDLYLSGASFDNTNIVIYDVVGAEVYKQSFTIESNKATIDISGKSDGIYTIHLSHKGQMISKKLIVTGR